MGTLLLHDKSNNNQVCLSVDVVDGQQRLTTLLIFIATALKEVDGFDDYDFIKSHYITHPEWEQKFETISKDNDCFRTAILGIDTAERSMWRERCSKTGLVLQTIPNANKLLSDFFTASRCIC